MLSFAKQNVQLTDEIPKSCFCAVPQLTMLSVPLLTLTLAGLCKPHVYSCLNTTFQKQGKKI